MAFIEQTHTNPNAVTRKLDGWGKIVGSDLIMTTIHRKMDELYEKMYKVTPVKTGYLRSTINTMYGDGYAQITVAARYAYYVDQGKSPRGPRRPQPFWSNSIAGFSIEMIIAVRQLFMTVR